MNYGIAPDNIPAVVFLESYRTGISNNKIMDHSFNLLDNGNGKHLWTNGNLSSHFA